MTDDLYELRPHQLKALEKLANGKILWGGVGTGKSRVAAAYYHKYEAPKQVYIITTAKKRDSFDWQEEFYRLGIGPISGPAPIPGNGGKTSRRKSNPREDEGSNGSSPTGLGGISGVQLGRAVDASTELLVTGRGRDTPRVFPGCAGDSGTGRRGDIDPALRGKDHDGQDPGNIQAIDSGSDVRGDHEAVPRRGDHSQPSSSIGWSAGVYPWVVTVDSWNNIGKYSNVSGAFFIFDEQRLVGSGDWTSKFLKIAKRNRWILLSGTPGDTWMDYIPVFVANNFYKNRTAFKREHVVYNTFTKFPKVDRYINVGKLMRHRSQLLVEMPYERHTKRQVVEVYLPYDKEALEMVLKKRWNIYENRPLRDVAEMFMVGRKLVNSDPSRLEMVRELWEKHPKLIVFYNFNYELEMLRTLQEHLPTTSSIVAPTGTNTVRSTSSGKRSISSSKLTTAEPSTNVPVISERNGHKNNDGSVLECPRPLSPLDGTSSREKPTTKETKKSTGSELTPITPSPKKNSTDGSSYNSKDDSRIGRDTSSIASIAEWNGHKHQPIPSSERWIYLVQYRAGAEGWNCIETNAMVMYSRNYSWKIFEQACGRIDRLNTPFDELFYYDLTSDSFIDRAIGRSLRAKETFNEAKYMKLFGG